MISGLQSSTCFETRHVPKDWEQHCYYDGVAAAGVKTRRDKQTGVIQLPPTNSTCKALIRIEPETMYLGSKLFMQTTRSTPISHTYTSAGKIAWYFGHVSCEWI